MWLCWHLDHVFSGLRGDHGVGGSCVYLDRLSECPSVTCILCIFCGSEHTTGSWGHQGMFLSLSFSICVEGNTGIHVCDRQGRSGNRGRGVGTV